MIPPAFAAFVDKWVHPDWRPLPVSSEDLDRVEARFETCLPVAYRRFMEQVGAASTGSELSEAIVEQRLDIPVLHEFFSPQVVQETTQAWREMGLPENMVAFAAEGSGDLYCFEVVPETEPVPSDALVWYFDHEERKVECLDIQFSPWLTLYANVKRSAA